MPQQFPVPGCAESHQANPDFPPGTASGSIRFKLCLYIYYVIATSENIPACYKEKKDIIQVSA